ncbi:MAG: PAS domain-containing sensor histidine kinase [bacterium]|nr:PAS domain-containing sensor histidine kinase [bacterium]
MHSSEMNDMIYKELFEQVPINISIIDRNYNIIKANSNFEDKFGEWNGKKCFSVYKKRNSPCEKCMASLTFEDGLPHVDDELGADKNNRPARYVVHTAPVKDENGDVVNVIEMSTDITEIKQLQRNYHLLFERVPCYVAVMDKEYNIVRANERFRDTFGDKIGEKCYKVYKKREQKCDNCPAEKAFLDGKEHQSEQFGITKEGKRNFYSVNAAPLARYGEEFAHVIEISTDMTEIKKLEAEKLESERMAVVGHTVAGLAHGVKNILTAIQGGMYVMNTGLQNSNADRIFSGWDMLERNINKITTFVKDFLSFARGEIPSVELVDPAKIALEIVELYKDDARKAGVELECDFQDKIRDAYFDPDGLHACLANLVSNAIDACQMSEKKNKKVVLRVFESKKIITFEVEDNGIGMDYEIKQKVFTTFFTTKGTEGSGIGLLTSRKLVVQHGGDITMDSELGSGSVFRMTFPRKNLTNKKPEKYK